MIEHAAPRACWHVWLIRPDAIVRQARSFDIRLLEAVAHLMAPLAAPPANSRALPSPAWTVYHVPGLDHSSGAMGTAWGATVNGISKGANGVSGRRGGRGAGTNDEADRPAAWNGALHSRGGVDSVVNRRTDSNRQSARGTCHCSYKRRVD